MGGHVDHSLHHSRVCGNQGPLHWGMVCTVLLQGMGILVEHTLEPQVMILLILLFCHYHHSCFELKQRWRSTKLN